MIGMSAPAILVSVAILGGLGVGFALLIALAHRRLRVWEDPRIEAVGELLPGTNCGACGLAGCRAFAEGLVQGRVKPAQCTSLGREGIQEVAEFLGVEAGVPVKRVARLLCAGGSDVAVRQAEYIGVQTCAAAAAVAGGGVACPWACLGLGDCVRACTFDAMYMNRFGLPVVLPDACTACGDCVEACPRDLYVIMPIEQKLIVQCRNLIDGDEAKALCAAACTGCGLCVADAAPGLIRIENGLAVIDYDKNERADPGATARCPTGAIVWVEGRQFTTGEGAARREPAGSGVS